MSLKYSRSQIAQKSTSSLNKSIARNDGFMTENQLDDRMKKIQKDFQKDVKEKVGIKPLSLDWNLESDYPHELWKQGVGQKEYSFQYIIPYLDKKGNQKPITCYFKLTKRFPLKEGTCRPEIWGSGDCIADHTSTKSTLNKMRSMGYKLIKKGNGWSFKST